MTFYACTVLEEAPRLSKDRGSGFFLSQVASKTVLGRDLPPVTVYLHLQNPVMPPCAPVVAIRRGRLPGSHGHQSGSDRITPYGQPISLLLTSFGGEEMACSRQVERGPSCNAPAIGPWLEKWLGCEKQCLLPASMTLKSLYGCSGKHRQVLGRWMYLLVEKPTGRPLFANTTTGLARVAGELGEALAGSFSRKLNQDDKNLPRFSPLSTPIHVQLTRNKVVCFCGRRPRGF